MDNNDSVTRAKILDVAYKEICRNGFRGANINRVVTRSGMTKGALYYYFKGKSDLSRAVVDEMLAPQVNEQWIEPLKTCDDPIQCIQAILSRAAAGINNRALRKGVPLVTAYSEYNALDQSLRRRFDTIRKQWVNTVAGALRKGQSQGVVTKEIDPRQTAYELQAYLMGVATLGRAVDGLTAFKRLHSSLIDRLEALRAA